MRRTIAISLLPALLATSVLPVPDRKESTSAATSPVVRAGRTEGDFDRARAALADLAPFVPNQGQWTHKAHFAHRSGPMMLLLEDRGWVLDLDVGVALRMTFEGGDTDGDGNGDGDRPEIVGEDALGGHHNYFLGADARRWRTGVPLYASVRYKNLYPGIDLRLRRANGVPEYDLLLQPGAGLARVSVHVEGAQGLSITPDGALIIATARGSLSQPQPKTWQIDRDGRRREVVCEFTLLGADRFGFAAPGWDSDTSLTIDPGLIWSTFLGGSSYEYANAVAVEADGAVTVAGHTFATDFPPTLGAYDPTMNGSEDVVVTRLDPNLTGSAQLLYSTFVGGAGAERAHALSVDANGVVTATGYTTSADFPVTAGAYDTTYDRSEDGFVIRLDPARVGSAQLVYSTFLGGNSGDLAYGLAVDAKGVATVLGRTFSSDFPTTAGAYDTTPNDWDVFVSRLDPSLTGAAQLVYSTYLGGKSHDWAGALAVDAGGVMTVAGYTDSTDFPTTSGAFSANQVGPRTVFVSRLDPSLKGSGQLVYSTLLGGSGDDRAAAVAVDANGVVTVVGHTGSTDFPTTAGAFDPTHNGGVDAVLSRLDPRLTGGGQLVYSTFLGGARDDRAYALSVDSAGIVTLSGETYSSDFPATSDAYDQTYNGSSDGFVSRLDLTRSGAAQLVHSTFLGGNDAEDAHALAVDASGVVTVAGGTLSLNLPTTAGAYDSTHNGSRDIFVSRLRMDTSFYADRYALPLNQAGSQTLRLDAGAAHANQGYAIFGSVTGARPGIDLSGVHIPLNVDFYTNLTIGSATPPIFVNFRGTLDSSGQATASFNVPSGLPKLPPITLHHAYIVFDKSGTFLMASNAVPLRLQ